MSTVTDSIENCTLDAPHVGMACYLAVLLGGLGAILGVTLALNLLLGARGLGSVEATRAASAWQQQTKGVTYAPPINVTQPFKVLRLADRLPQINAMVLGSSALMGVTESMFPAPLSVYNFTLTGNSTAALVGEAEYIERMLSDSVRWLLIGLDWSVGMIYLNDTVAQVDLSPAAVATSYAAYDVPLYKRIEDALSWPRVATLGKTLRAAARADHPLDNLRHTFFDIASAEYRCSDGAIARDFDVINRGLCRGYRYDGSWTFANDKRLTPALAATYAIAATARSSKYTQQLCARNGEPNPAFFARFGAAAQRYAAKGGHMVFLLPPLAPGMEREILHTPKWKTCLERTKAELKKWSIKQQVTIIDAGQSERYGCVPAEFADEHHAYPECYARLMQRYFRDRDAGRVQPGLYQPWSEQ